MGWIRDKLARVFVKSPSRMTANAIEKNMDAYLEGFEEGLRRGKEQREVFVANAKRYVEDTGVSFKDFTYPLSIDRDKVDETKDELRG